MPGNSGEKAVDIYNCRWKRFFADREVTLKERMLKKKKLPDSTIICHILKAGRKHLFFYFKRKKKQVEGSFSAHVEDPTLTQTLAASPSSSQVWHCNLRWGEENWTRPFLQHPIYVTFSLFCCTLNKITGQSLWYVSPLPGKQLALEIAIFFF